MRPTIIVVINLLCIGCKYSETNIAAFIMEWDDSVPMIYALGSPDWEASSWASKRCSQKLWKRHGASKKRNQIEGRKDSMIGDSRAQSSGLPKSMVSGLFKTRCPRHRRACLQCRLLKDLLSRLYETFQSLDSRRLPSFSSYLRSMRLQQQRIFDGPVRWFLCVLFRSFLSCLFFPSYS